VISWLKARERQCPARVYHFQVECLEQEIRSRASLELAAGRLRLTSGITLAVRHPAFFTAYLGSYLYRTQVLPEPDPEVFASLKRELFAVLEEAPENLIPAMANRLGEDYFTVHDVFQKEKEGIFLDLLRPDREAALAGMEHHFAAVKPLLKAMAREGLPLPPLYRSLGETTLSRRLVGLLRRLEPEPQLLAESPEFREIIEEAGLLGLKLEAEAGAGILQRLLDRHLRKLKRDLQEHTALEFLHFLELLERLPVTVDLLEVPADAGAASTSGCSSRSRP